MPPVMSHRDSRHRAEQAWRLRCRGRTWNEIAEALDFKSRRSVQRAVATHLERNKPEAAEIVRRSMGEGLTMIREQLLDSLEEARAEGDHQAVATLARAATDSIEKQARLMGLHIAVATEVNVNVVQTMTEIVADTRARLQAAIDAEVVPLPPATTPEFEVEQ